MTRYLLGTLTFGAVISAILVKFFSQLAFAGTLPLKINPADLAGDGRFLGQYEVIAETSKGDDQDNLCDIQNKKLADGKSLNCGDNIWAYQKDKEILFINVPNEDAIGADELNVWLVSGKCKGSADISEVLSKGVFNFGLCSLSSTTDSSHFSTFVPAPVSDALSWIVLIHLGSEQTLLTLPDSASGNLELEDIYKGQGIDNKLVLKKVDAVSVNTQD